MQGKQILLLLVLILYQNGNVESSTRPHGSHLNQTKGQPFGQTSLVGKSQGVRQRREIPEAMLDPYSVLGVLSFGVYIFYILYSRYRMRGHHSPAGSSPQQQPGGTFFNVDAQENFANILKMATKIISNASQFGNSNSTIDSDDYFDGVDDADLRRKRKNVRK